MSPRRFDGWEPTEVHVNRVTDDGLEYVEVIREPEWSEDDRIQVEALIYCEQMTCRGCGCWLPESTHKESFVGLVDKDTCYGCSAIEVVRRKDDSANEGVKPSPGHAFWSDGLRYGVRAATPEELQGKHRPGQPDPV